MSMKAIRRQLIAAVAMVLVAAIALGSSTFAWFSMNNQVTASNMQVKAVAEQGLLINEIATAGSTTWDSAATTNQDSGISLHATSTANTSTWYVAYSTKANSAAAASSGAASGDLTTDGYQTLGTAPLATTTNTVAAAAGTNAQRDIVYVDADSSTTYEDGEGYYVKYTYYLKSSAGAITCGKAIGDKNVRIKSVEATGASGSADLDAALRVAIVMGGKAYIYAPVAGATTSYYVAAAASATTTLSGTQATNLASVPASTEDGTPVYVYIYFEGEDAKLMTDSITETIDTLNVTINFELVTLEAAATDNGVAVS